MEKIVTIDIQNKEDLVGIYDSNIANYNLIDYILKKTLYTNKNDKITFIIHNKCNTTLPIKDIIINGLNLEYEHLIKEYKKNTLLQIALLFLGLFFLFLSTILVKESIWHEFLVIAGWVPLWEMIDIELFSDSKNRRKKHVIEKLLKCEFKIED